MISRAWSAMQAPWRRRRRYKLRRAAVLGVGAVLLAGWSGTAARGQGVVGGVVSGIGGSFASGQAGQPYSCIQKTTTVQKLVDGTTITHTSSSHQARDSEGRTMQETKPDVFGEGMPEFIQTSVMDPVKHIWITWDSQSKHANVMHIPDPADRPPAPPSRASAVETPKVAVQPVARPRPVVHREQLGGKTIAGIYAEGARTTTTYQAGMMGNDQPIVTVQETWRSRDLNLVVLQTNDDPRSGVRTTEVTELDRGEPDPKLFQVPDGYIVKEQKPNQPDQ